MIEARARMREPQSLAEELAGFQLMGQYPDDPDARSLYEAAYEKWGVTMTDNE